MVIVVVGVVVGVGVTDAGVPVGVGVGVGVISQQNPLISEVEFDAVILVISGEEL